MTRKYELVDKSALSEATNILQEAIDKELKSSSRDMLAILHWELNIITIQQEIILRSIQE